VKVQLFELLYTSSSIQILLKIKSEIETLHMIVIY